MGRFRCPPPHPHAAEPGLTGIGLRGRRLPDQAADLLQDLLGERHHAAHPPVEGHRDAPGHRQHDVVQHLAGVHLHHQEGLHLTAQGLDGRIGEGAEGQRTEQPHPDALGSGGPHRREGHPPRDAEAHHHLLGVVQVIFPIAHLPGLDLPPALQQTPVGLLLLIGVEVNGSQDTPGAALSAGHRPLRAGPWGLAHRRQLGGLHHLADAPIRQHHGDGAVALGQIEGQDREVDGLLHRRRGQSDHPVIPVAAAADNLVVIPLGGRDVPQAGAAAHHVDDHAGHLRARDVGEALHHQADARTGGRGHHPGAGAGRAVDHVDGRDLALRLHEHPPQLRHAPGHILQQLGLWGDGIPEIRLDAGPDGRLRHRLVALQQLPRHARLLILTPPPRAPAGGPDGKP
jgi:hypothetical protein